jgi:hypothetical protein
MKASILLPLAISCLIPAVSRARPSDQGFWANMGSGDAAGRSGLCILDHEQGRELIIGQGRGYSPSCWRAFRQDLATGDYRQIHCQPPTLSNYTYGVLATVTTGDVDPRPGIEVIVGGSRSTLSGADLIGIYDGTTKELIRSFQPSDGSRVFGINSLIVHDLDADGRDEILVNAGTLLVMKGDGTFCWSCPSAGERVALGQLDDDPALELAGTDGKVIDLGLRAEQWSTGTREFWTDVLIHDVDGDGVGNLLGFEQWGGVSAVDIRSGAELWRYERPGGISAVLVGDIDGEGTGELVVADAQWGGLHVLRLGEGPPEELYQIDEPGYDPEKMWTSSGTSGLLLADPDSDGRNELVWCYGGGGGTGQGPSQIFIYDPVARAFEWVSPWRAPPNGIPKIGDVTGDGKPDLVTTGGGEILVYDTDTLALLNPPKLAAERPTFSLDTVTVGLCDLDGDGWMEIAVADRYSVRVLKFRERLGFEEIWRASEPAISRSEDFEWQHGGGFESVTVLDVDGDGGLEVIVTLQGVEWSRKPDFIQVFDFQTGRRKWISGEVLPKADTWLFSSSVLASLIKDTDDDGHLEIVAALSYGPLAVIDLATGEIEAYDDQAVYSSVADMPGDVSFLALQKTGLVHEVKAGPEGYELYPVKFFGSLGPEIRAFAPAPQDRWWVITKWRVGLVAPDGSWDWVTNQFEGIQGGFAFLDAARGPEFFVGWTYGIAGFHVGHLFQKPQIRVETMRTPAESGRLGYLSFRRGDVGVGPSWIRFTLAGTAKLGVDFTMAGAFDEDGDGVWEFGLNDSSDRGVTFYPINDGLAEGSETVVLQLQEDPSFEFAVPGPVEVVLEDDEPRLSVQLLNGEVSESTKGSLEFLVERTGDLSMPLSASYRMGGTADAKDYTPADRSLEFKAGVGSLKLRFAAKADKVAEAAESVIVELEGGAGAWVNSDAAASTGWILDSQPMVRLAGAKPVPGGVEVRLASEVGAGSRVSVRLQLETVTPDGGSSRKVVMVKATSGAEAGRFLVKSAKTSARMIVTLLESPAYHRAGESRLEFAVPPRP